MGGLYILFQIDQIINLGVVVRAIHEITLFQIQQKMVQIPNITRLQLTCKQSIFCTRLLQQLIFFHSIIKWIQKKRKVYLRVFLLELLKNHRKGSKYKHTHLRIFKHGFYRCWEKGLTYWSSSPYAKLITSIYFCTTSVTTPFDILTYSSRISLMAWDSIHF